MPLYALICTECEKTRPDEVLSIKDRDALRCECGGVLTNDYARHETSNFSLKGSNWPGKLVSIENKIMKEKDEL